MAKCTKTLYVYRDFQRYIAKNIQKIFHIFEEPEKRKFSAWYAECTSGLLKS